AGSGKASTRPVVTARPGTVQPATPAAPSPLQIPTVTLDPLGALGQLATSSESSLRLAEVVASVERHYPLIEAAQQDQQAAQAELLSARGGFDPSLVARAEGSPLGYYQNGRFDLRFEQPTPLWGTNFFAGYRASVGKFADYDGKLETNQYGELRAGMSLPLWRNGSIDRRRAAIKRAELGVSVSQTGVVAQRIDAIRLASLRYFEWVATGQRLALAKQLLELAQGRDQALAIRVERGDLPQIDRVDNQRALLQRQGLLVSAQRSLQQATIELSIYLRDAQGEPLLCDTSRLPARLPAPSGPSLSSTGAMAVEVAGSYDLQALRRDVELALRARPELQRLQLQRQQLQVERDLAKNQMAPAIDVQAAVSQDFGPGSETREKTTVDAGVVIDIPLRNRVNRGRVSVAESGMQRISAQQRLQRDRIFAELADVRSALLAASARAQLAESEVQVARDVEAAEKTRYELGDSTLLLVNLREQATAEAALRQIDALLDYHRATATYRAVLAQDSGGTLGEASSGPAQAPANQSR
ncbi:MAG TPA: TolC family protein, partial [Pseudomonadota bacterium]|nr:TolC family protein [Pseudomonadota bacterium]